MESFDYVIAGGGTAGCVLANRLATRGHTVCLIEAGPPDKSFWTRIPAGFTKLLRDPAYSWQLKMDGSPGTNGRSTPLVQGRTLGGSSTVNGAVYSRGQALDFDTWAALGNPGWSYADLLPYFRSSEHYLGSGDDAFRGRNGPVGVTETPWRDELCDAFIASAEAAGIPRTVDYNGASQAGIGYCQGAIEDGRRWSTARAYLAPALSTGRIRVVTDAAVSRIEMSGRRATGVVYHPAGSATPVSVGAHREVIVCAGAIHSPKLLQLSGIGPAQLLRDKGVEVVHALDGVGENLHDHFCPRLVVRARPDVDSINSKVRGLPLAKQALAWLLNRPSIMAITPILVYGFWKTRPELASPDFVLSFMSASYKLGVIGHIDAEPGLTCGAWQLRPESQGCVRISSGDFRAPPVIFPNYLDHETDRRVTVDALKWARRVFAASPVRDLLAAELLPGPDVTTDDELLDFARQYGTTGYHVTGTCKMGPASDPMAVVGADLRVHGMDGLRVIDSSIMPTIPSANTCAATIALAEKGADLIPHNEF